MGKLWANRQKWCKKGLKKWGKLVCIFLFADLSWANSSTKSWANFSLFAKSYGQIMGKFSNWAKK
jgi:hypothetical protein